MDDTIEKFLRKIRLEGLEKQMADAGLLRFRCACGDQVEMMWGTAKLHAICPRCAGAFRPVTITGTAA